jgi:sensor histidine kinase YesM
VVINIYREDDVLVYKVFNEGRSVDEKEMEELMREERPGNRGLAVRNVSARLKLQFGSGYAPVFENVPGGVLVTIHQPVTGMKKEEGV